MILFKLKTLLIVSAVIFLCTSQTASASEALLRTFLAEVKTLSADFTQKVVDESGMTLDFASGQVYLQRPGRFRWDYAGEDGSQVRGQQLVADGESIFLFDPDLEQVTQRSLRDAINQVPSLLLVQDGKTLNKFFLVSDIGLTDGLSWVALKPKAEDASFQQLLIGFAGGKLDTIHLLDGLGNETRLNLSNVENNNNLKAGLFNFVVPDGADLLQE